MTFNMNFKIDLRSKDLYKGNSFMNRSELSYFFEAVSISMQDRTNEEGLGETANCYMLLLIAQIV